MSLLDQIRSLDSSILATMDTQLIADNLPKTQLLGMVSRAWFATWAAGNGMRAVIEDTATTIGHPLRSIALACKDVLGGAADGIDLSLPENQAMVSAWVQVGAMAQSDADALFALATTAQSVNEMDVRRLCWSDDGVWQI